MEEIIKRGPACIEECDQTALHNKYDGYAELHCNNNLGC